MKIPGYSVHRKIGKGGMASVFLATQTSFDRKVALKIIAESTLGGREKAEQFMREAKIVGGFSHPNIVPVYDVGRIEQFHFLAMDYLQGGDLASWIKSGLQPEECEQIITQVANALHFAHNKGYLHRDIKPENILFREDNSAVLTDFGIAQPLKATSEGQKTTVVGTPSYMSPELIQGKPIDNRCDLYALGIMFYEMLTRQPPFQAETVKALAIKHIKEPPPKLPFALRRYQPIIDKLLAKNPDDRFESALAFAKALGNVDGNLDMASISHSIRELKIVEEDVASASSKSMEIEENSFRKFGFMKLQRLSCTISCTQGQEFNLLFSQFTTRLLEWHDRHGKKCAEIVMHFSIDPLIQEFIERKLASLYTEEVFKFVKKIHLVTSFSDLAGKPLQRNPEPA